MLNQRQEDLQRKNSEVDAVKENLAAQLELVDKKKQDLEKLHQREIEHLETLSGLSAEEAKERLIESLKDEAKSEATSYINEIMEEAKMTANKEAKKNRYPVHPACSNRNGNREFDYSLPYRIRRDQRPYHRS